MGVPHFLFLEARTCLSLGSIRSSRLEELLAVRLMADFRAQLVFGAWSSAGEFHMASSGSGVVAGIPAVGRSNWGIIGNWETGNSRCAVRGGGGGTKKKNRNHGALQRAEYGI